MTHRVPINPVCKVHAVHHYKYFMNAQHITPNNIYGQNKRHICSKTRFYASDMLQKQHFLLALRQPLGKHKATCDTSLSMWPVPTPAFLCGRCHPVPCQHIHANKTHVHRWRVVDAQQPVPAQEPVSPCWFPNRMQ